MTSRDSTDSAWAAPTTPSTPPSTSTTSLAPFLIVTALVLAVTGWLGWHLYDQPSNPGEARIKATEMTRIVVDGLGGSDRSCPALPTAVPGDTGTVVARCNAVVNSVRGLGLPAFGTSDMHVTDTDLHRRSGSVTVAVTFDTAGQVFTMTLRWPMRWVGGHWWVASGPEVHRT